MGVVLLLNSDLISLFQSIFQTVDTPRTFFAPGRINLIGEHTDYNGGHVLPAPISFGTFALANKRLDQKIRLYSHNFPENGIIECDLQDLSYNVLHEWANYPKGMIRYICESGRALSAGMDILYYGTIPNGAGLSSSASIEMVTGVLFEQLFDIEIDRIEMIHLGKKVENDYIGVNSGIMDQFAIGKGKKDHAILLNCQTLEYRYAPVKMEKYSIMIINTNKRRSLKLSSYNERRTQCEQALKDLKKALSIDYLCQLSVAQFEEHKHLIQNNTNRKRAKHVIYENERTLEAMVHLQHGDLTKFGELMNKSHLSLQKDYEVTGEELDTLVQAAWEQTGVVGARMTGAGFGGCAIAIVENAHIDAFTQQVHDRYTSKIGYEPTFYKAAIGDGARELIEGACLL